MELLDRYLEAVKKHLPWQRQDDIIAELKANLEEQLEDKQAELGRPLTKEEAGEWLKQMGSPMQVAAHYQRQQYLIGPAVFPMYWYVLRLALTWCTIIYAVAKVVEVAANGLGWKTLAVAALQLPLIWLINAAVVTAIFAGIEMAGLRLPGKFGSFAPMTPVWSPADLPALGARDASEPQSLWRVCAEVIFGCLFFAWLLLIPHYPFLWLGPGAWYLAALPYKLAPVWWTFYWCVVAMNAFELAWRIVDFTRGAWQKRRRARHFAMHALALIPLGVLVTAPDHALFLLKNPVADAAAHGADLAAANKGIHQALMIAVAVVALQLVWWIGKAGVEAYRKRVAALR